EIPESAQPLLERLVEHRLLMRDQRPLPGGQAVVVEVAHEALLRQWSKLTAWLDEEAEVLKVAENVRRAAVDWNKNARHADGLTPTGARLAAAEAVQRRPAFGTLIGSEGNAYLEACRARDERVREDLEAHQRKMERTRRGIQDADRIGRPRLISIASI